MIGMQKASVPGPVLTLQFGRDCRCLFPGALMSRHDRAAVMKRPQPGCLAVLRFGSKCNGLHCDLKSPVFLASKSLIPLPVQTHVTNRVRCKRQAARDAVIMPPATVTLG